MPTIMMSAKVPKLTNKDQTCNGVMKNKAKIAIANMA